MNGQILAGFVKGWQMLVLAVLIIIGIGTILSWGFDLFEKLLNFLCVNEYFCIFLR
jgi:hypothetical protein